VQWVRKQVPPEFAIRNGESSSRVRSAAPAIFIIDDSGEYRSLLTHHVTTRWPEATVRDYDPTFSGRLPEEFSGAGNDLVLLGHPAGGEDALEWLRQFRKIAGFPPVVVIGSGDERHIVEAMRAGAAEYLSKARLNHSRLVEVMETALGGSEQPAGLAAAGLPSLKGYRIRQQLSGSDISTVYLTTEERTGRPAVLKVLRQMPDAGNDVAFERFLQEYELIAKLKHPSIVEIYDLGIADDHAYIAMEYCAQGSLKRRIASGMNPDLAFRYMRQMADALGELHRVGITHRDMKPTNVMFRDDGSLVLIDFGLAKQAQLRAEITGTGEIFGTPYYMSPEQGHAGQVDQRGDIYSLGVMFYEMLTGEKPFDAETPMAMIIRHRHAPVPTLPGGLGRYQPAIDRMLAKKPEDRFQDVDALLAWSPAGNAAPSAAQA
jgi:tRNA A-37 threonylcarbamoyl transferase component Bud32/FixJ family two-component response regulator